MFRAAPSNALANYAKCCAGLGVRLRTFVCLMTFIWIPLSGSSLCAALFYAYYTVYMWVAFIQSVNPRGLFWIISLMFCIIKAKVPVVNCFFISAGSLIHFNHVQWWGNVDLLYGLTAGVVEGWGGVSMTHKHPYAVFDYYLQINLSE